jgi:hypothetical protein
MLADSMATNYTLRRATSAAHVYQTILTVTATGKKNLGP